jgi:NAD(P)-dependent dehydrogenase (short-subunit alcohol dehydrogenase family)
MDAIEDLKKCHPELAEKPEISFLHLDLASLESCMTAASTFLEEEDRLDILSMNSLFFA